MPAKSYPLASSGERRKKTEEAAARAKMDASATDDVLNRPTSASKIKGSPKGLPSPSSSATKELTQSYYLSFQVLSFTFRSLAFRLYHNNDL